MDYQNSRHHVLLIHPPLTRACESPAGLARLAGCLIHHAIGHYLLDANLEGILYLLKGPKILSDTWTNRAHRHLNNNISALKNWSIYENIDRYKRAIMDINRILQRSVSHANVTLSLTNYMDRKLSPIKSIDLLKAAEEPEKNPFYPYFQKRLPALLEQEGSDVIGFSVNYLSQALCAFAMIGFLRRIHSRLRVILGGGLITSWLRNPRWQNPFSRLVDDMIAGPGEGQLLSMLGMPQCNNPNSSSYDLFNMNDYLAPGPILPYSASRGCYWHRCAFCPERAEHNPYQTMAPERIIEDLQVLIDKTKPVLVHFLDNAISPAFLKAMAGHNLDVPWYGFARITDHLADPDFCMALKKSGCVMLKLGLESGDQSVLDALYKGIDLAVASQALKSLKKAGISTYLYLLFGTPPETLTAARRTLDFTIRHSEEIGFLNLAIFNLPINGPDVRKLITKPFYDGDMSLYSGFEHSAGWNRGLVRQFIDKEFKRHDAVASILKNDPPFFTSSHAPFFVMTPKTNKPIF